MSNIKDNKFNAFACNKATRQELKQNNIDDDFKYILKRITEKRKMELEYKHFMARYDLEDLLGGPRRFIDEEGLVKEFDLSFSNTKVIRQATDKEIELQNEVDDLFDRLCIAERELKHM